MAKPDKIEIAKGVQGLWELRLVVLQKAETYGTGALCRFLIVVADMLEKNLDAIEQEIGKKTVVQKLIEKVMFWKRGKK